MYILHTLRLIALRQWDCREISLGCSLLHADPTDPRRSRIIRPSRCCCTYYLVNLVWRSSRFFALISVKKLQELLSCSSVRTSAYVLLLLLFFRPPRNLHAKIR